MRNGLGPRFRRTAEPEPRQRRKHLDLAEVLRRAGRTSEAARRAKEALHLYARKGNSVAAARARTLLEELHVNVP